MSSAEYLELANVRERESRRLSSLHCEWAVSAYTAEWRLQMQKNNNNFFWLLLINGIVAVGAISCFTVFAPYTVGSDYGISRILSWMIVVILLLFAGIMDYSLLFAKSTPITKVDSIKKCIQVFEEMSESSAKRRNRVPWRRQIEKALHLLQLFQQNEEALQKLSYAKFDGEEGIAEYQSVILELEESMVDVMQHILTRLCIMDASQFFWAQAQQETDILSQYSQHESYIDSQLAYAARMNHSFAELITEVSLIGDKEDEGTIHNLEDIIAAMRRLNSGTDAVDDLAKKYQDM